MIKGIKKFEFVVKTQFLRRLNKLNFCPCLKIIVMFATNYDFLIPTSSQPNVVDFGFFNL